MNCGRRAKSVQGTFGNLGMYAAGAPVGFLIDSYGPRRGVMLGAFLMGLGYTLLHRGMRVGML